jgi:hypothetical protein
MIVLQWQDNKNNDNPELVTIPASPAQEGEAAGRQLASANR